jgi:hypothetical protein
MTRTSSSIWRKAQGLLRERPPTTPSGTPSTLASISSGAATRVSSTVTLNFHLEHVVVAGFPCPHRCSALTAFTRVFEAPGRRSADPEPHTIRGKSGQ